MFGAYSRRVDRKMFSEINSWLRKRSWGTDQAKLGRFTRSAASKTAEEFFSLSRSSRVKISKNPDYPWNYNLSFQSQAPSGYSQNDLVQGEFFPSHPLGAPSVILVSGWFEGPTDYSRMAHWVGLSGRNLWVMDHPYHVRRTPEGTRSGELAITGDLVRTLGGIRQAVLDVRVLVSCLWELGSRDIALLGFSLGAWVSSLVAMVEPGLSKAILVTPVVRADKLFLYSPFFSSLRKGVEGSIFERIRHLFLPAYGAPSVDPKNIYLVGAREDPLARPEDLKELSERWGCESQIMPGGHITLYVTLRLWRRIFSLLSC